MIPTKKIRISALLPKTEDSRDYSHTEYFGSVAASDLPTQDFLVSVPVEIKNQDINYLSDYCTAYAATEVAEDEDQVIMVPEYTFALTKALIGDPTGIYEGMQLRDICSGAINIGFLPRLNDPYYCGTDARPPRSFILNASNWPSVLKSIAAKYKKQAYFSVDGPHDLFDNIRATMWMNLGQRRSIIVGCIWRESWSEFADGMIPETYESGGSGHAFKFCGQKTINGEIRIVAQLSDGKDFGDNGYFYFPRSVVNKEFGPYGQFTFKDLPDGFDGATTEVTTGVPVFSYLKKIRLFISNLIKI